MVVIAQSPAPQHAAPVVGWDSEAFVVCGADRADLRERALVLATEVEHNPSVPLAVIAARLAADLRTGGSRLAVVASSPTDLVAKLRRGADRVADPKCKQVRDTNGLYFFETPLSTQGTLALLFPGEGAQYPGMLADLCGVFPEVEDAFSWCDRLAAESGRSSLRTVLHPAPEDKAAAEIELRQLGPSIFGVLLADLAITRVLQNLQLPVSAVAGHSAGELAALLAAGAMDSTAMIGPSLIETTDLMQRLEDEAGGDVALLAVGAGRAAVEEVAANVARGGVVVAMDNCPHQSVAVGPTHLVAAVEAALLERGLVCERLPFRRPYHTPLFEQWMPQFRELFARIPFEVPHTPIYSCSTGRPFPNDPDAIRDLAVNHWVSPVEFTRMIESMYADGVRIFVEAGPRGNLSAFAEDVLRGKPCAVIPANVFRKSGPTQVNHMVAQLAAHHVPLNLAHLYAGRVTEAQSSLTSPLVGEVAPSLRGAGGGDASTWSEPSPPPGSQSLATLPHKGGGQATSNGTAHDPVMDGYFSVMEQFLDVQREVVEAFFTGHAANGHISALPEFFPTPEPQPAPEPTADQPFCFLGDAVQFEAGREAVFRRTLDLHEDLYVDDHTLGGRGVSRTDPKQNGLPVLPMTFSLEAMAAAASALVPGKVVTALRDVRLYRWVPYENEPTTFEIRVSVASVNAETGVIEVKANVRDLGNSFVADAANKPSSEATVVLADRYPDPPEPLPFVLSDGAPCVATVDELRRNMFHGPVFQMLRSLDRFGKEGIEGTLEVQARDTWFRSNPNPRTVIDPVLVDAAMHILGAWHLEQPDWSGRILLPIGMKSLEFFGPLPEVGSRLLVRGHNEEETARQARNGAELFGTNGRPWFRLSGAGYWRFYLPFGDTNFFGPKDQYFLSSRVTEAEASAASRCYFLDPPLDLQQPALRASGVRVSMTPTEQAAFIKVQGTDAEKSDWFFSRLVAKDAARALWNKGHASGTFPADMESEVHGNVVLCRQRAEPNAEAFPLSKFAETKGRVAAFASTAERFGVGLVLVKKGDSEDALRMDAARLAAADALGVPADSLTATTGPNPEVVRVAHGGKTFRVQTARHKDVVIATTVCEVE